MNNKICGRVILFFVSFLILFSGCISKPDSNLPSVSDVNWPDFGLVPKLGAEALCGNNIIDAGEECDNKKLGGKTCKSFGFDAGVLKCSAYCKFDSKKCIASGKVSGASSGVSSGGASSGTSSTAGGGGASSGGAGSGGSTGGSGGGSADGGGSGTTDAFDIAVCGNNVKEADEQCDGIFLGGANCVSLGYVSGTISCLNTCQYDISKCVSQEGVFGGEQNPVCGNGLVEVGEQCDGSALANESCVKQGFFSGVLSCSESCKFNTSKCVEEEPEVQAVCGNKVRELGEFCDGADFSGASCVFLGFVKGTLACTTDCKLNTSACVLDEDMQQPAVCGNGVIEETEECDGTSLNNQTCIKKGFIGGTLSCTANCAFSTSNCISQPQTVCGNNVKETEEQCDGSDLTSETCITKGFVGGALACSANCVFNTSSCTSGNAVCGNNIREVGEQCDGSDLANQTCVTKGFFSGSLSCSANCTFNTNNCTSGNAVCGNNIREAGEQCDGSDLASASCVSLGFTSGTLSCSSCSFNTNNCQGGSANPNQEGADPGECMNGLDDDGDGKTDCFDSSCTICPEIKPFPYSSEIYCFDGIDDDGDGKIDCKDSQCYCYTGECGNNLLEGTEQCDGTKLNNKTCVTQGFASGTLSCKNDCTFNTTACVAAQAVCGNNVREGTEQCDGVDLNSQTCITKGYLYGTLACLSNCTFNTAGCGMTPPQPSGESICNNGLDDDGDGKTDCFDSDCTGKTFTCSQLWNFPATQESYCKDGIDDDGDGKIDCADVDCTMNFYELCSSYNCSDTDSGRYDYLNMGTCTDDFGVHPDECVNGKLREYGCNTYSTYKYCVYSDWTCPNGCSSGKCTGTCTEADAGKNYFVKATTTSAAGSMGTDSCNSNHVLREFYCSGAELKDEYFDCWDSTDPRVEVIGNNKQCLNGTCCEYHHHKACEDTYNRSYWYDSCGQQEDYVSCSPNLCSNGECVPLIKIFVTNGNWNGNFGGIAGADSKCQTEASNAGLSGNWKAFLSDSTTIAKNKLPEGIYKRIDGALIANSKADLFDNSIANAINITASGSLPSESYTGVWTGSNLDGSLGYTCDYWIKDIVSSSAHWGNMNSTTNNWWINGGSGSCNGARRLYCFSVPA